MVHHFVLCATIIYYALYVFMQYNVVNDEFSEKQYLANFT